MAAPVIRKWDRWNGNDDSQWTNVVIAGGPVGPANNQKLVYGSGVLINQLGSWWSWNPGHVSVSSQVYQFEMKTQSGSTFGIVLWGLSRQTGIQSANAVAILFNSFPTPHIVFNDYGEVPITATQANEFQMGVTYTGKLIITGAGTAQAYVSGGNLGNNYFLGETTIANNLLGQRLYVSHQQTFINPSTNATIWDNFFIHDEGITFNPGSFMAYATLAQLTSEFPNTTFDSTTQITDAEVNNWLSEASEVIDGWIANRYAVPVITGTKGLIVLRDLCQQMVAAKIKTKLYSGSGEKLDSQIATANAMMKDARERLQDIKSGKLSLVDAAQSNVPTSQSYENKNAYIGPMVVDNDKW